MILKNIVSVFLISLSLHLVEAEADLNAAGIDEFDYLFGTKTNLYFKNGTTTNALARTEMLQIRMDYNYAKGLAYFQDSLFTISSVPLHSNMSATANVSVADGKLKADLIIDWIHDRIIWSECDLNSDKRMCEKNTIISADLQTGGDKKTLQVIERVGSIVKMAVDPFVGKIFWITDYEIIASCNLDGSDLKTIQFSEKAHGYDFNMEDTEYIGLTLDLYTGRIFYTSVKNPDKIAISSIAYDGKSASKEHFTVDKTPDNMGKQIAHIDVLHDTVFIFRSSLDVHTLFLGYFTVEKALLNGTIEARADMYASDESIPIPAVMARLVHPDLQPASDPKSSAHREG